MRKHHFGRKRNDVSLSCDWRMADRHMLQLLKALLNRIETESDYSIHHYYVSWGFASRSGSNDIFADFSPWIRKGE